MNRDCVFIDTSRLSNLIPPYLLLQIRYAIAQERAPADARFSLVQECRGAFAAVQFVFSLITQRGLSQCGSGHIHEGGFDRPIMKCEGCKVLSCFRHDLPWVRPLSIPLYRLGTIEIISCSMQHYDTTCEEFGVQLAADVNNAASKAYIDSNTKTCPKCKEPYVTTQNSFLVAHIHFITPQN